MNEKSKSSNFEELTHQFHEKYRTTGIALAISIATLTSAECWFFYKKFLKFNDTTTCFQHILWTCIIVTSICLFASSFILQFLNYYGMKEMAQSFFRAYKFSNDPDDANSKKEMNVRWEKALSCFKIADLLIIIIMCFAVVNFIAVVVYFINYKPPV